MPDAFSPPLDPAGILATIERVQRAGLAARTPGDLLMAAVDALSAAGLRLIRANMSQLTIHPLVRGYDFDWWDGEGLTAQTFDTFAPTRDPTQLRRFPFYVMQVDGIDKLRQRLDGPTAHPFPIYDRLRDRGATDYYARIFPFDEEAEARGPLGAFNTAWATDRPGGFSDDDIGLIERVAATIAPPMRYLMLAQVAYSLSEIYLGQDAGQRVLLGEIQRGSLRTLRAAILYADMQGSTGIADGTDPRGYVDFLNAYFEGAVAAIHDAGGQVLKFMGDGLLAIFTPPEPADGTGRPDGNGLTDRLIHRADRDREPPAPTDKSFDRDISTAALAAVDGLRAAQDAITQSRLGSGEPITRFSVAVHLGDVMYGNIGGRDRLDFTVVGPAVNEAARLLAMTRPLERDTIVGEAVVRACTGHCPRLIGLGRYMLRGVSRPRTLYTLLPPGAEAEDAARAGPD